MRNLYIFATIITLAATAAFAGYPRLGIGGNASYTIPIGDLAADDLDTGYQSVPALRGKIMFHVFNPLLFEAGGFYGLNHKAKTGITEGQADWACNYVYAGTGALVDMGLFMPHLTAGLSYFWIKRDIAEMDKNDRDILLPVSDDVNAYGYYIELGMEYYLYEHLAIDFGVRFDQALTSGRRASLLHFGGGVDWYVF
jgi:opacity protein-like surface antigen